MSAVCLVFLLLVTGDLFAAALLETGQNVVKKTRLIKVLDKYPTSWITDWNCEADFPADTCRLVRDLQIDIGLVYILTEELACRAGWSTTLPTDGGCTAPCQADSYGENCAFRCRCVYGRNCNPVDGSCDCFDGFTGPGCYTRCDEGEFGPNCKNKTYICENRGINHPVTGECLCPDGYRGDRCEAECNPFTDPLCGFDCELCYWRNTDYCDYIVSACRCNPGWRGLYCTEPCAPGNSGLFCHDFCCSGKGFCDEVHDRCLCLDGYSGDNCQDECEDGFFGRDCRERCPCPSCHHVTGECDMCPHGYFGNRCTEPCPPDRWGKGCNSTCVCPTGERCDVFMGQCSKNNSHGESSTTKYQSTEAPRTQLRSTTNKYLTTKHQFTEATNNIDITQLSVFSALSLLGLLAITLFICLLICVRRHWAAERRKTFLGHEPPITVMEQCNNLQGNHFNRSAEISLETTVQRNIDDTLPNIPHTREQSVYIPALSSDGYAYLMR